MIDPNRELFINSTIPLLYNKRIIEYDMREAGFSLIQHFKLLPEKEINLLKKLDKERRKIQIGLLERESKELRENLKQAFVKARTIFYETNQLEEWDIISVKKDAIFTTKICMHTKFGDFIEFRPKNTYTAYIQFSSRKTIEIYYSDEKIDVKGISDDVVTRHQAFLLDFIGRFIRRLEMESVENVIDFLRRFIDKYKRKELPVGYYREFNSDSMYRLARSGAKIIDMKDEEKNTLDISYNFKEILIRLAQLLI